MENFENNINKKEEVETDAVKKERERVEYLLERTNKVGPLDMPEFLYNPNEFKEKMEKISGEFGGFRNEEERREIARRYNSLVPEHFYLIDNYIFVVENPQFPKLASFWDKEQKELEERNPWEWYN